MGRVLFFSALLLALGIPVDAAAQVQRSFQNLGFEQPALTGSNCYLIFSADSVPGWDTDHPNNVVAGSCTLAGSPPGAAITRPIEIWRGPAFSSVPPRAGNQHAELNAYVPSRLSQTICLANGEQVDWKLSHRGRDSATIADVMNFNIDSTANTVAVLSSTNAGTGVPPVCTDAGGIDNLSCSVAAGPNGWRDYTGTFVWNGASGNHNFGFQAVGGGASGNFLDEIQVVLRPYVEIGATSYTTREGQAATLPQIRISGTVPAAGITVLVSITGGTATLGSDYSTTSGTTTVNIPIAAGTYDAALFDVPISAISDDSVIENNETVTLQIQSNAAAYNLTSTTTCGAPALTAATLGIGDNDVDVLTTKTVSNANSPAGGTTQYTLTYRNNTAQPTVGNLAAHDAVAAVADAVPAGLVFTSWTCAASAGATCPAASGSGAISGNATLPAGPGGVAGGFVTYTIVATLGAAQCTAVTNTSTIAANAPVAEGTSAQGGFVTPTPGGTANNTAAVAIAPACADLSITKTNNVTSVTSGSIVDYAIAIANAGPAAANGSIVRDPAPTGLTCTTASCGGIQNGAVCPATTGPALLTALQSVAGIAIPTLPANGGLTFTVTCTVQ